MKAKAKASPLNERLQNLHEQSDIFRFFHIQEAHTVYSALFKYSPHWYSFSFVPLQPGISQSKHRCNTSKGYHQASDSMKTKELSTQVRGKVVEKTDKNRLGFKKISQTMNISRSTIKSFIGKWNDYGTTANLAVEGHPPKMPEVHWHIFHRGQSMNIKRGFNKVEVTIH